MNLSRSQILFGVATIAFAVLFVLALFVDGADKNVQLGLLYGGLTAFAAAHI